MSQDKNNEFSPAFSLERLNPQVLGLIWVTRGPLSDRPKYFTELDYLFDGLLVKHCDHLLDVGPDSGTNLLLTQNFGKTMFLGHVGLHEKNWKEKLDSIVALMKSNHEDVRKQILVLQNTETSQEINLLKHLSKKFSDREFLAL